MEVRSDRTAQPERERARENQPSGLFIRRLTILVIVAGRKVVLCATSVPTKGALTQPAVFITNTAAYASNNMKATTVVAALKGSIVVYLNNNIKPVDLYYFDLAGRPSKLRVTINPSN